MEQQGNVRNFLFLLQMLANRPRTTYDMFLQNWIESLFYPYFYASQIIGLDLAQFVIAKLLMFAIV